MLPYFYSVGLQARGKNMNYLKSAFCCTYFFAVRMYFKFEKLPDELLQNCYFVLLVILTSFHMNNNHKKHLNLLFEYYIDFMIYLDLNVCVYVCLFRSLSHIMINQIKTRQKKLVARIIPSDNTTNLSHNEILKPEFERKIFYCKRR